MDTIGTRPEEDESYNNALALLFSVLGCVVGFSVLEWIFYYLYNNKVSKDILKYVLYSKEPYFIVPHLDKDNQWNR